MNRYLLRGLTGVALVAILAALLVGTKVISLRQAADASQTTAYLESSEGTVHLRDSERWDSSILATVHNGTRVVVRCVTIGVAAYPDRPNEKRWYIVTLAEGKFAGSSAYVFSLLVKGAPALLSACEADKRPPLIPPPDQTVKLSRGPAAPSGYWYAIEITGQTPNTTYKAVCYDHEHWSPWADPGPGNPGGFRTFTVRTDGHGAFQTQNECYSGVDGFHVVWLWNAELSEPVDQSNEVRWGPSSGSPASPATGTTPPPATGQRSVTLAQGAAVGSAYRYAVTLRGFAPKNRVAVQCYDSVSPNGFFTAHLKTDDAGNASTASLCHSADGPDHWVRADGVESNHVTWTRGGATAPLTTSPPKTNPPPPSTRTLTIYNKVTNGATTMREDSTPIYLSSATLPKCKSQGCALPGTDMWSGHQIVALCHLQGSRLTNGQDNSSIDDNNPGLLTSTLWYRIRWSDGRVGYISEIWIAPGDREIQGLPTC